MAEDEGTVGTRAEEETVAYASSANGVCKSMVDFCDVHFALQERSQAPSDHQEYCHLVATDPKGWVHWGSVFKNIVL